MDISFYQAECGDAARIHFIGNDGKPHNIFIDSGFNRTFRHVLDQEITNIQKANEKIDLWIISHIHDDHIDGVLKYIQTIQDGEFPDLVDSWLYNSPRIQLNKKVISKNYSISEAKSIEQGDRLSQYMLSVHKPLNNYITYDQPIKKIWGLKLTILSPSKNSLQDLLDKYDQNKATKAELAEYKPISEAKGAAQYDYYIPLEQFNLGEWKEDDKIENGSSIAVLTELENKKILWLADAYPSIVVTKLNRLGYSKENPLICDWVKVSHHGSDGNTSNELLDLIHCKNYVFSTNGENTYCLPNKKSIARILRNGQREKDSHYNLHFTHDNPTLRNIFKVDGDGVFEKFNFSVQYATVPLGINVKL